MRKQPFALSSGLYRRPRILTESASAKEARGLKQAVCQTITAGGETNPAPSKIKIQQPGKKVKH